MLAMTTVIARQMKTTVAWEMKMIVATAGMSYIAVVIGAQMRMPRGTCRLCWRVSWGSSVMTSVGSPSSELDSTFRSDFRFDRYSNINGARSAWSKLMLKLILYRQLGESRLFADVTCLPIKSLVDMLDSVSGGKSRTLSMMPLWRI